jgi:hypothetical protein
MWKIFSVPCDSALYKFHYYYRMLNPRIKIVRNYVDHLPPYHTDYACKLKTNSVA